MVTIKIENTKTGEVYEITTAEMHIFWSSQNPSCPDETFWSHIVIEDLPEVPF